MTPAPSHEPVEFAQPADVLQASALTREEKLRVLLEWDLDLREQLVAEEENMAPGQPLRVSLGDVRRALTVLHAGPEQHSPTKHG